MAWGAWEVETACRMGSGGLDDLVRPDAARADAQALDAAVHERADPLQVRLEPAGVTLCAWLMLRPTTGPFPQISQRFAIGSL